MINIFEFLNKFVGPAGAFVKKVATEVAAEEISAQIHERTRSILGAFSPGAKQAYEAITASLFGSLTDATERAFATIVAIFTSYYVNCNLLSPTHAHQRVQEALQFLRTKPDGEFAKYRQMLARDPDEMRRVVVFGQLVQAENDTDREIWFQSVVGGKHTITQVIDLVREYGPKAIKFTKESIKTADDFVQKNVGTEEFNRSGQQFMESRRGSRDQAVQHLTETVGSGFIPRPLRQLGRIIRQAIRR